MRKLGVVLAVILGSLALAGPANAHIIEVTTPAGETVHEGWVGGGGAAHVHGLVNACMATADNDVLTIHTTWNPANSCTHF